MNRIHSLSGLVALLSMLFPTSLPAADLGVLLTTPMERAEQDKLRGRGYGAPLADAVPEAVLSGETHAPMGHSAITLRGAMRRGNGAWVAWVNQTSTMASPVTPEGVKVAAISRDGAGATLRLVDGGGKSIMRVGQSWDLAQRTVSEIFPVQPVLAPPATETHATTDSAARAKGKSPLPVESHARMFHKTGRISQREAYDAQLPGLNR